jgi:hypothetical protein
MAEGEYRRLCSVGTCDGQHKAQGYCLRHYRQWQRGGIKQDAIDCVHCGAAFTPRTAGVMYCTKACKLAAWKAANRDRWLALNVRKVSAIHAAYCVTCGAAYVSRSARRYCSPTCKPSSAKPKFQLGVHYIPPVRTCVHCGLQWSAIRRVGRTAYCQTTACQEAKRKQRSKKAKASHSHVSRAKKHGRRYGYFNVMRVFERDRWRCQLCGVKTPKSLRGTIDPRAPEIGHIVAVADGGDHLIENIQCECRACNAGKGVRARGQTWLEGFADSR